MIRCAEEKDVEKIMDLLIQVCNVHAEGRPDIFKPNTTKYEKNDLLKLFRDDTRPIFVFTDEEDEVQGYAFCIFQETEESRHLHARKTLYIDDLCVDKGMRGQHIGKQLYEYVLNFAKTSGCDNVTLNVWSCNPKAMKFYEACGLLPMKTYLEIKL